MNFLFIFADMLSVRFLLLLWIGLAYSATMLTNIDTTIQPTVQISLEDDEEDYEEYEEEEEDDEIDLSGNDMVLEAEGKVEQKSNHKSYISSRRLSCDMKL